MQACRRARHRPRCGLAKSDIVAWFARRPTLTASARGGEGKSARSGRRNGCRIEQRNRQGCKHLSCQLLKSDSGRPSRSVLNNPGSSPQLPCSGLDIALFTVYPSIGVVLLGTHHARDITGPSMPFLAPAMYWYGWTATAAIGALMFGLIGALLPERLTRWFWPGWLWVVPALAMIACVYLTIPWFRL